MDVLSKRIVSLKRTFSKRKKKKNKSLRKVNSVTFSNPSSSKVEKENFNEAYTLEERQNSEIRKIASEIFGASANPDALLQVKTREKDNLENAEKATTGEIHEKTPLQNNEVTLNQPCWQEVTNTTQNAEILAADSSSTSNLMGNETNTIAHHGDSLQDSLPELVSPNKQSSVENDKSTEINLISSSSQSSEFLSEESYETNGLSSNLRLKSTKKPAALAHSSESYICKTQYPEVQLAIILADYSTRSSRCQMKTLSAAETYSKEPATDYVATMLQPIENEMEAFEFLEGIQIECVVGALLTVLSKISFVSSTTSTVKYSTKNNKKKIVDINYMRDLLLSEDSYPGVNLLLYKVTQLILKKCTTQSEILLVSKTFGPVIFKLKPENNSRKQVKEIGEVFAWIVFNCDQFLPHTLEDPEDCDDDTCTNSDDDTYTDNYDTDEESIETLRSKQEENYRNVESVTENEKFPLVCDKVSLAVCAYNTCENGKLDIEIGDSVKILKRNEEGMCFGVNRRTGRLGEFPSNFVVLDTHEAQRSREIICARALEYCWKLSRDKTPLAQDVDALYQLLTQDTPET